MMFAFLGGLSWKLLKIVINMQYLHFYKVLYNISTHACSIKWSNQATSVSIARSSPSLPVLYTIYSALLWTAVTPLCCGMWKLTTSAYPIFLYPYSPKSSVPPIITILKSDFNFHIWERTCGICLCVWLISVNIVIPQF